MKKFRTLFREEVECRVASTFSNGVSLVLYKDARVDMNLLDEYFPNNWEDSYERIGNTLFCSLTLYTENGKRTYTDCGTPSNAEAAKGEVSDAFKRACTKAGIGRGLYTVPFIFVRASDLGWPEDKDEIKERAKRARFVVSDIAFAESRSGEYVDFFEIIDKSSGQVVYSYTNKDRDAVSTMSEELGELRRLISKLPKIDDSYLCKRYKVNNLKEIADSKKLYSDCKSRLEVEIRKAEKAKQAAIEAAAPTEPSPAPRKIAPEEDSLNAFIAAANEAAENVETLQSEKPEEVIFECIDEAPANVLALRGMRIGDIPLNYIKEFARSRSKIRTCISQISLDAIDEVRKTIA